MAKFLLFAGADFYPSGGWDDFRGLFNDVESAKLEGRRLVDAEDSLVMWWHVVSLPTLSMVAHSCGQKFVPRTT